MSFASPFWLAALLLVPLALVVQRLARRRAARYAIRFPAVATLRAAASGGTSWYRHVPVGFLLAGIATLAVALARPHATHRVAIDQASIMLVTDHSGSMAATDVQPTRLAAAEQAADTFISRLPSSVRVGAVAFSSSPDASQGPLTTHAAARAIVDGQSAGGATATGDALEAALQLLGAGNVKHPPSAIVLLSDGSANTGADPVSVAHASGSAHIPIYTVALGTPSGVLTSPDPYQPSVPVPPDPALMQQIAQVSGGRTFNAQTADELSSIYTRLGSRLGSTTRKSDITAVFAAGGLVFVLLAAAGSARLSGRLP
jgi:Ca-activated chloride channel family protein